MPVGREGEAVDETSGSDVASWLVEAQDAEAGLQLTRRADALDRAEESAATAPEPPGRSWRHEIDAERAIDLARLTQLQQAGELARRVLADAPADALIARARATEALGRALAWTGTRGATTDARRLLVEAAERYGRLDRREWQAYAIFFRGNAVHLQNGELLEADRCMREALALLPPDSPRRPAVLSWHSDVLIALGRWDDAAAPLEEGARLADESGDPMSRAYMSWSRARLASVQGNALATERYIREAEREAADWFDIHTGPTFLADAAELLDRVGLTEQAHLYLARAAEHPGADEFVDLARAALLARSGNPMEALDALQELVRGDWLEKRLVWRLRMLTAFATLRLRGHDAGALAAEALEVAVASGGVQVATRGEPEITAALLPLAEAAGSETARTALLGDSEYLVRLFGLPVVVRSDGSTVAIPPGQPSELVRMLAVHPRGMAVEEVLDAFFPDVAITRSRQRLRQILTRLRAAAGDLVLRSQDHLTLAPAWVDTRAFRVASDRVRASRGPRAAQLAHAAIALWAGPPLPADSYTSWASPHRRQLTQRYLSLLDLVASDAAARNSHEETLAALTAAIEEDPDEPSRYELAAAQLRALGRPGEARHLLQGIEDV